MTRLTPEREAVIFHLESVGEATPSQIAEALGRSAGSTRLLLREMLAGGLVRTPSRGHYAVPTNFEDGPPNFEDASTNFEPNSETPAPNFEESSIGKGQIFAYSEADGGMISNSELRRRKGYRDS